MTIRFLDGFDHYAEGSTGNAQMLDGAWADMPTSVSAGRPTSSPSRTGGKSLFAPLFIDSESQSPSMARRVLNANVTEVGVGAAYWFNNLPATADDVVLVSFRNSANRRLLDITLQTTGAIRVITGLVGSPTVLHETELPVVTAGAWQHIESYVLIDDEAGAVEVRVNGITVINLVDVITDPQARGPCSQIGFGTRDVTDSPLHVDDIYAWDTSGSFNNDFIGDRRIVTLYPDSDTSSSDYTSVGATGYDAINDATPDDDSTYIVLEPLGGEPSTPKVAEFGLDNLSSDVVAISAVQTYVRMRKTDAGDCNVVVGLTSGSDEVEGSSKAITSEWTYWMDVFETDPATGAPWIPADLDAAVLKIVRED